MRLAGFFYAPPLMRSLSLTSRRGMRHRPQMARPTKLSEEAIRTRLSDLQGWTYEDGALRRNFEFPDFARAFGFMTTVALHAERADHHPDWSNVYNKVHVALSTHDAGGVTDLDFDLAAVMDRLEPA